MLNRPFSSLKRKGGRILQLFNWKFVTGLAGVVNSVARHSHGVGNSNLMGKLCNLGGKSSCGMRN